MREYRRHEGRRLPSDAATASHTIPVTVAAEQGVIGLVAYVALLAAALARLLRGAAGVPVARSAVAAAFLALLFHTLVYAAFLEDPMTWALLGIGTALAAAAAPARRRARRGRATAAERSAARRAGWAARRRSAGRACLGRRSGRGAAGVRRRGSFASLGSSSPPSHGAP